MPQCTFIDNALPRFIRLLDARLAAGVPTTEDAVRYTFFAAMLEQIVEPHRVVPEYDHPALPGRKKIDTVLLGDDDRTLLAALEFKYDRPGPAKRTQPRTKKAGAALKDIGRLLRVTGALDRLFVHLADVRMRDYLSKQTNGLTQLYRLAERRSVDVGSDDFLLLANTLVLEMGTWPCRTFATCLASTGLPGNHKLWVFRLNPSVLGHRSR